MLRQLCFVSLVLVCACRSSTTAPPSNALVGRWGGPGLGLVADGSSVHAQFDCDFADFRAPLVPEANGQFVLPGTTSHVNSQVQIGAQGVASGDVITIAVIRWYPGGSNTQQFTVTRDKPADLSTLCALADIRLRAH